MDLKKLKRTLPNLPTDKQIAFKARLKWLRRARPKQIPPSNIDWFAFLALAGRGFGKTRICSEDSWWYCAWNDNVRLAVVAPTNSDLRRTVFEGESGLLNVCPPELLLSGDKAYNKGTNELRFLNGSVIQGFSSESYQRLRGPQFHRAWLEELAAWPYLQETWDMLNMTLRLVPPKGRPQLVISTTPKPFKLIKELNVRSDVYKVTGGTYENRANLAESFLRVIEKQYSGTRLGKQELEGLILDDVPGALWNWTMIERARYLSTHCPEFSYITVSIDPSVGDGNPDNDECGIVATAIGRHDGLGYVLGDSSMRGSPNEWVSAAVKLYRDLKANWIVAESNNGGKLIESAIRAADQSIPVRLVHASKGKRTRAEPVAMLYEQNRIRHFGVFGDLETQMCEWSPEISEYSPGRMDALVWGFTALMVEKPSEFFAFVV